MANKYDYYICILFNYFSDQLTKKWLGLQVCHHLLCSECVSLDLEESHCPVCNIKFNTKKHVRTIEDMKASYSEIEEVVFCIFASE